MSVRAQGQDLLAACAQSKEARTARVSSWDHSGEMEPSHEEQLSYVLEL